jgi:hypothetical protein
MFSKNSITLYVAAAVILSLVFVSPAAAQRRASAQVGSKCVGGIDALFDEIELVTLTDYEETTILYLLEEEKLSRDVYTALADTWQLPIFSNIAGAEQRHMNLVWKLIEAYGIVHAFTDDTPGVFVDPSLASLYSDLVAAGEVSLVDALWVGADIEDMDLFDLYEMLDNTDNAHIKLVIYNLAKGSRNHLRAFVKALGAQDVTYTPTYLSIETFDEIIDAGMEQHIFYNADGEPVEACGGAIGGFGQRRGHGGDGGQGNGSGSGEGDGSGSNDGGNGNGNGECDGSGSDNGGNGNGECDGSGSTGGGNGNGNGGGN